METRHIVMVCNDEGNVLLYETTLTNEELTKWAEKKGLHPHDVFEEKQENLQYYLIDGRLWMDEEKDNLIRTFIKD